MAKTRRKKRSSGFTDAKAAYLAHGVLFFAAHREDGGYNVARGTVTAEILADARDRGPDVVAERIAERPGTRPWCFWVLHLGVKAGSTFHMHDVSQRLAMRPQTYLHRNGLLNSAEQNYLKTIKAESWE